MLVFRLFILLFTMTSLLFPCRAMDKENEEERIKTQRLHRLETQLDEIKALKETKQSRSNFLCDIVVVLGHPNLKSNTNYYEFNPCHPDEIWLYIDSKIKTHQSDRKWDYFLQASFNGQEDLAILVKYLYHRVDRLILDSSWFQSSESTIGSPEQLFSMLYPWGGRFLFVPCIQVGTELSVTPIQHFPLQYTVCLPKELSIENEKDKYISYLVSYFVKHHASYIYNFLQQYFKKVTECHPAGEFPCPYFLAENVSS